MIQNKTIMAEKVQINADKLKVLDAVMQKIEKDFGKGSIMRMNSTEVNDIPVIPTGSITLDMAPVSYTHLRSAARSRRSKKRCSPNKLGTHTVGTNRGS